MQPQTKRENAQLKATSIDPVCGMAAGPSSAGGASEYEGKTYYFCSPHCRKKFEVDPQSFIKTPSPLLISRATAQFEALRLSVRQRLANRLTPARRIRM